MIVPWKYFFTGAILGASA